MASVPALVALATAALSFVGRPQEAIVGRWLEAWQAGQPIEPHAAEACAQRIQDAMRAARGVEAALVPLRVQAFDILGLDLRDHLLAPPPIAPPSAPQAASAWPGPLVRLRTCVEAELSQDQGVNEWALTELLPRPRVHPHPRRSAALRWLLDRPSPALSTAMMVVARTLDDPLRPEVLFALARWAGSNGPDAAIDQYLVSLLFKDDRGAAHPHPFGLLQERLRSSAAPLADQASAQLHERLPALFQSADWRQAARAIQLARGMELERRVPLLLDSLSLWSRRAERGRGSKRIEGDLVKELELVSGRRLGSNPGNWITWWIAVRQGQLDLVPSPTGHEDPDRSRATFFGLRPTTQRVTFVIDHSGSMASGFGTREVTRYEEAIAQMARFLQAAGSEALFSIVLFDSTALRSSEGLVAATPENVERARASLLARPPAGATLLYPGLELALCLDSTGQVDLEQLEADTIIVLCDGETSDGAAWIAPLLERIQPAAQLRFHCVQIGASGGEVLQELATRTGGEFVRISG